MNKSIINQNTNLGNMFYPFLTQFKEWGNSQSSSTAPVDPAWQPTFRWVKDNKICDLHIPDV